MSDQRFARGHIGVGLDPHGADRLPLTGAHLFGDGGKQGGVVLTDKIIKLGGGVIELELGELVHQLKGGVECAHAFAAGLDHRPKPGQVNMGMAGRCERAFLRKAAL